MSTQPITVPNNTNALLAISILQLILADGPIVIEEILKIKAMLTASPNVAANLKALFDSANTDNLATLSRANAWLASYGQPLIPVPIPGQ